jgi:hypothetical protein
MLPITPEGLTELSPGEADLVEGGGDPLAITTFLVSCFVGGFKLGFDHIGPALFN